MAEFAPCPDVGPFAPQDFMIQGAHASPLTILRSTHTPMTAPPTRGTVALAGRSDEVAHWVRPSADMPTSSWVNYDGSGSRTFSTGYTFAGNGLPLLNHPFHDQSGGGLVDAYGNAYGHLAQPQGCPQSIGQRVFNHGQHTFPHGALSGERVIQTGNGVIYPHGYAGGSWAHGALP